MLVAHKKKYCIIFVFLLTIGISSLYWWSQPLLCTNAIYAYLPQKDRAFILDLFQKNWYWLVSEYSTDFSAEYMLDNKASSRNPSDVGNLSIFVYRDSEPRGFVAWYKESMFSGRILFLAVDQKYRQK